MPRFAQTGLCVAYCRATLAQLRTFLVMPTFSWLPAAYQELLLAELTRREQAWTPADSLVRLTTVQLFYNAHAVLARTQRAIEHWNISTQMLGKITIGCWLLSTGRQADKAIVSPRLKHE